MTIESMMISQDGSVILLQPKLASGFTQHPNSVIDWFEVLKKHLITNIDKNGIRRATVHFIKIVLSNCIICLL